MKRNSKMQISKMRERKKRVKIPIKQRKQNERVGNISHLMQKSLHITYRPSKSWTEIRQ